MNPQAQTTRFLIAAVVSAVLATGTWYATRPNPVEGFGRIGESFFADLKVDKASALRVVAFDKDQATVDDFIVQKVDGVWELPRYNDYPADGDDQLGKTAASLVGTVRGALASRQANEHARLGVVDPEDKGQELEGRGQKISLFRDGGVGDGIKMAELIVGNEVPDRSGEYYVRIPDEKETYIAKLDIDLSTKFSDWVEDDLLKLDRDKLVLLESRTTTVDEQQIVEGVESQLTRESSTDDWKLAGLNEETEELNDDGIRDMVQTIDSVKIAGVRERPTMGGSQILDGDLKVKLPEGAPPQIMNQIMGMFQRDLQPKGFFLYGNVENPQLYTSSGELIAGTDEGIRYHMAFGDEFEGTDDEILIGGASSSDAADNGDESESDDESADDENDEPAGPDEESADDSDDADVDGEDDASSELKKSRYLFVRATVDETLLGPELVEPVKPAVPEGVEVDEDGNVVKPEEPAEEDAEDGAEEAETEEADTADGGEEEAEAADDADKPEGEGEAESTEEAKPDPADEYQTAIEKYRSDKSAYDRDVETRQGQLEEAKEKVEELNRRFGDWYYVISAEDFDKVRLTRDQLVKEKEKEEPEEGDTPESTDTPDAPAGTDDAPAKPADTPDADNATPGDDAKPTETPDADKPADDSPAETPSESPGPTEAEKPAANAPGDTPDENEKPAEESASPASPADDTE